jgi:uncharacterized protein YjbJ (UPF0337 family)
MSGRTWARGVHKFDGTPCAEWPAVQASRPTEGEHVNKDQIKGTLKDAAGKVQQRTGKVIGSTGQQLKGIRKRIEGQAQKVAGDIEEAVKDATRK